MSTLFNEILYRPFLNALVFLYQYVSFEDLGIAIILLTILVRLILLPLFYKSFKSQALLQRLQPEIHKIQQKYKDDRAKQTQEMLNLYRQHKVSPFGGFLILLVQLPILIALYRVILNGFSETLMANLYKFIPAPTIINNSFLGLINLKDHNILIVGLAVVVQYFQGLLSLPKVEKDKETMPAAKMGRYMIFIGPVLTFIILKNLPSAIGLYWLATSVFSIVQQIFINKSINKSSTGSQQLTANS